MSIQGMRDRGTGAWMMGAVTRNPEGLLLLAAGAALLMRSGRESPTARRYGTPAYSGDRSRRDNGSNTNASQREAGGISEAARSAMDYASETADKLSETARAYTSSATDFADETARAAMERTRRVADQAQERAEYVVQQQPWAVALTGLLAGVAVAAVFPPTRIEQETLGSAGQRLRSAAGSAADQVMDAGKKAGARLYEVAEEKGLTAEGLKDVARDVGETFSASLTGEQANAAGESGAGGQDRRSATSKEGRPAQGESSQSRKGRQSGGQTSQGERS